MIKYIYDRDYGTITDWYHITSVNQIEDDWTGCHYFYRVDENLPSLNSHEARKIFQNPSESLDLIFENNNVDQR